MGVAMFLAMVVLAMWLTDEPEEAWEAAWS